MATLSRPSRRSPRRRRAETRNGSTTGPLPRRHAMAPVDRSSSRELPNPRPKARFPLPDPPPTTGEPSKTAATVRAGDPGSEEQEWRELVDTLLRHRDRLLRIPGVTAVDVGYKVKE